MDYSWVKNVCVIDSMHALLQYLLLVSEEVSRNTFYFWGDGISSQVKENFDGHYLNMVKKEKYSWYKILSKYRFLLNNKIQFWGHDHLPWSKYIIRKHDFYLLEDGVMNYNPFLWRNKTTLKLRLIALWEGPLSCLDIPYSGYEKNCKRIHLTGIVKSGEVYSSAKVNIATFQDMWNKCDDSKRKYINKIFNIDESILSRLKGKRKILLTQPFSEDNYLTEEEKIDVYSKVLEAIGCEGVIIKCHPREKTDYRRCFQNIEVFDFPLPIQLIMLNGICFEEAYTIFSTAAFGFPYKIKVGFIGTQISQKLEKRFPLQTYKTYKCTDSNVEKINIVLEHLCK